MVELPHGGSSMRQTFLEGFTPNRSYVPNVGLTLYFLDLATTSFFSLFPFPFSPSPVLIYIGICTLSWTIYANSCCRTLCTVFGF